MLLAQIAQITSRGFRPSHRSPVTTAAAALTESGIRNQKFRNERQSKKKGFLKRVCGIKSVWMPSFPQVFPLNNLSFVTNDKALRSHFNKCVSITPKNFVKHKYHNKPVMETTKLGKTSQIPLECFDSLIGCYFSKYRF